MVNVEWGPVNRSNEGRRRISQFLLLGIDIRLELALRVFSFCSFVTDFHRGDEPQRAKKDRKQE